MTFIRYAVGLRLSKTLDVEITADEDVKATDLTATRMTGGEVKPAGGGLQWQFKSLAAGDYWIEMEASDSVVAQITIQVKNGTGSTWLVASPIGFSSGVPVPAAVGWSAASGSAPGNPKDPWPPPGTPMSMGSAQSWYDGQLAASWAKLAANPPPLSVSIRRVTVGTPIGPPPDDVA